RRTYHRALDLLQQAGELEGSVASGARASGVLRVGISAPLSRYVIMPRIAEFLRQHRDLQLDFQLTQDPRAMQRENLDLLFHVGEPPPSRYIAQRLAQGLPAAYAAPHYLRMWGEPRDPSELPRHRCLVFRPPW